MAERSLFAAALSPFFVVRLFLLRSVESRAWQPVWLSLPKFYRRECARDELLPETAVRLGVLLNPFSCSSNRFFFASPYPNSAYSVCLFPLLFVGFLLSSSAWEYFAVCSVWLLSDAIARILSWRFLRYLPSLQKKEKRVGLCRPYPQLL